MPVYRIRKTKAITIEKVNRPFRLSHGPTGPPGELSNATEVIANHPDVAANTSHRETIGNPHGTTAEDIGADPAGSALSVQGNLNTHVSEGGHPASNITLSDNDDFFPVKDAENSLNFITNILYQLTDNLPLFPFSIDSSVSSGTWTITVTSTVTSDIVFLIGLSRYSLPSPQVIDITSYAGTNTNPKDVYVYFEAPGGIPALVASNLSPEDKDIHHVNVSTHLASEVSADTVNIRAEIIQHASIYEHIHDYWHTKYRAPASYISGLDVSSSPTVISVGSGVIEKIHERLETEAISTNLGFFEILADGSVSDKVSFDFSNYSDGGTIGVNKYYWVTIGVTTNGETLLVAVVQPEPLSEFQQAANAFEDGRVKAPVFPGDDILDKTFVPVCMIVVYSGNDQAQENPLRPGTYHHDLRGASSYGTGGGVTGLSQVESDDTLSGNGTPLSPIGVVYGSTINTSCEGNDPRLSDSRNPNQHTHAASEVTDFDAEVANNTAVASNTAKVSADGSVTTHNDVVDAGSGQIITNTERTKLNGIEGGATADQTGAEIKAAYESEENTNAFTDAEKAKLAGLENEKFLGTYVNLSALQTAHPTPVEGSYGHVDTGIGNEVAVYIWDASDLTYYQQAAASSAETATSVKSKYESNPDTNAFTDAEKNKLAGVELSADVTDAENVGDAISGTAEDLNPADTGKFAQVDIDGNLIHTTFGTIKSLFKDIFDILYAPIAKGVTGGDSHNHAGGEGGAISADSISETATREFVSISTGASSDYYRGDKTWADFFTPVRATTLTGLDTSTNEVVDASDTVLSAAGKLQKQMTDHKANNGSDHSAAILSTGKPGGQTVPGGTGASENLALSSTTNTVKGKITSDSTFHILAGSKLQIGDFDDYDVTVTRDADYSGVIAFFGEKNGAGTSPWGGCYLGISNGSGYLDIKSTGGASRFFFSTVPGVDSYINPSSAGVAIGSNDAGTSKLLVKGGFSGSTTEAIEATDANDARLFTIRDDGGFAFKGGTVGLAQTGYTAFTNANTRRTCDALTVTLSELAEIVNTMIQDDIAKGLRSA